MAFAPISSLRCGNFHDLQSWPDHPTVRPSATPVEKHPQHHHERPTTQPHTATSARLRQIRFHLRLRQLNPPVATVKNFRGINRSRAPRIRGAFSLFIPRFLDLHHRRAQALRAGDESKKNARPTPSDRATGTTKTTGDSHKTQTYAKAYGLTYVLPYVKTYVKLKARRTEETSSTTHAVPLDINRKER